MMDVFQTWLSENADIDRARLEERVKTVALDMVELEKAFIKLIFAKYDSSEFFGLTANRLERYVEYVADHRMESMNFAKIFNTSSSNPLPELTVMINAPTHTNFFENTSTDYAHGSTKGTWTDVWG